MWNLTAYIFFRALWVFLFFFFWYQRKVYLDTAVCCWMSMFTPSLAEWSALPARIHSSPFNQKLEQSIFCIFCSSCSRCALRACGNLKCSAATICFHIFATFLTFPSLLETLGVSFCNPELSVHMFSHVCTIFSSTDRIKRLCKSAHLVQPQELHGLLAPRRATGSQIGNCKEWSVSSRRRGTKSSIWRIVNKCQKYILCRQA